MFFVDPFSEGRYHYGDFPDGSLFRYEQYLPPAEDEIVVGDFSWGDLERAFNPLENIIRSGEGSGGGGGQSGPPPVVRDIPQPRLAAMQAALAAAQARQAGVQGPSSWSPGAPVPITVPSFALPQGGFDMSGLHHGPRVAGFHDLCVPPDDLCGLDILGAAYTVGANGRGRRPAPRPGGGSGAPAHKQVMVSAGNAYNNATAAANLAAQKVARYGQRDHLTAVHGLYVGAGPLTPKQQAAIKQHQGAIAKGKASIQKLAAAGAKAATAAKNLAAWKDKASPVIQKFFAPRPPTTLRGAEILGDPPPVPDPTNPGFLTDGSPDPNAGGGGNAAAGPGADGNFGFTLPPPYDPSSDPNVVPLPVRGQTLSASDAQQTWQNVPDGAIAGPTIFPMNAAGTYSLYYREPYRGLYWNSDTGRYHWGTIWSGSGGKGTGIKDSADVDTHGGLQGDLFAYATSKGLTPFVGNPNMPEFAGLQWAAADKVWFWQSQNAPSSAAAQIDAQIAAGNEKIIAADKAAADTATAAVQHDIDAAREAWAKQQAQNALAESAATSQANVMQTQQTSQQGALDIQQRQLDQQLQALQAKTDAATQAAQLDFAQKQQQADIAAQQWAMQNQPQEVESPFGDGAQDGDPFGDVGPGEMDSAFEQAASASDDGGG